MAWMKGNSLEDRMQRPSFLDQEPPPGYIAGVGRGATGFSTRGDQSNKAKVPKRLQTANNGLQDQENGEDTTDGVVNKEDEEALEVFGSIEAKLSSRRKPTQNADNNRNEPIPAQFADLKRSLATVSEEEWLNLPDAGDMTRKNKRERLQDQLSRKEYAAPDTLINRGVNFSKLTEERERLLGRQLDNNLTDGFKSDTLAAGNDTGNYLDELESIRTQNLNHADQIEEIKRMRAVLLSYRNADPKRAEGWIASARLEEKATKFQRARSIMEDACLVCPKSDEIWLERIRMNASDFVLCRALAAEGIKFNPKSLALWLKAAELENEPFNKRRVVMKALQELPKCEKLWKEVISFESDQAEQQRILRKAVELVPESLDLLKELIHLQDYTTAKKSLNAARKYHPTNSEIWILAAQLEERSDDTVSVQRLQKLLSSGMNQLHRNDSNPSLSEWLNSAQNLDIEGTSPKAAIAIVQAALGGENANSTLPSLIQVVDGMSDSFIKIIAYRVLLNQVPTHYKVWGSLKDTCLKTKRRDLLYETYEDLLFKKNDSFETLRQAPTLVLIYAKEVWKHEKNIPKALKILKQSIEISPNTLDFWVAELKVLCFSSHFNEAEETFLCALKRLSTADVPHLERLYWKYVSFLRFQDRLPEAIDFLERECFVKFSNCYQFYLQKGQIHHDMGQLEEMRDTYSTATTLLPHCSILWIMLAKVDEVEFHNSPKARSELDIALLRNPQEEALYLAKIQMETRVGNFDQARLIVLQALQKFPNSPEIWSENIRLIPPKKTSTKKTVFQDALKNTKNNCQVLNEIGLSFFRDGQYVTASKWFERAAQSNPAFGDTWVWLARCSKKMSKDVATIVEKVEEHEPVYGPLWTSVTKDIRHQYNGPSEVLSLLLKDS